MNVDLSAVSSVTAFQSIVPRPMLAFALAAAQEQGTRRGFIVCLRNTALRRSLRCTMKI